jgi:hypothetical protein
VNRRKVARFRAAAPQKIAPEPFGRQKFLNARPFFEIAPDGMSPSVIGGAKESTR